MSEIIPADIQKDIERASALHQRAAADYHKCREFNALMSDILGRLEDARCYRAADQVMTVLLNCQPRDGVHCDKSSMITEKITKMAQKKEL
jgi:hypothetical protein